MVQRIQTLVMDAIDNKNDRQVIKTKLGDVIKELQDLETKDQRIETENAELKREMRALNVTLNNTKFLSMEEIRNLNKSEIHALRTHFASDLQDLVKKEEHISAKIISLNETEISNLKRQTLALQKENLNLIKESRTTKSQLEAIERKLDALNSSYSVSEIEIQKKIKVNLQNDNILRDDLQKLKKVNDDIRSESVVLKNNTLEMTEKSYSLMDQLNEMNETLHKISASNVFDRLASTENMFRIFSASVNKSFENLREDLNESSLQLEHISNQLTSKYKMHVT
ncbi:paramyosin-like [Saccostrea echinata]|uniref:paramyosin-like n=1 Tax=Saccostrea echinata TaxID=191078 RepID=UPI002A821E0D|nr:paramyosin-like [Saccostrea echinata]